MFENWKEFKIELILVRPVSLQIPTNILQILAVLLQNSAEKEWCENVCQFERLSWNIEESNFPVATEKLILHGITNKTKIANFLLFKQYRFTVKVVPAGPYDDFK